MNTDFYPCHLWLKLSEDLEARGGVEPRAFRPALEGRFRRPVPGTRAAVGGDGETRTHTMLFTRQLLYQLELHRLTNGGRGVRPTRLCELHGPGTVFVLPG